MAHEQSETVQVGGKWVNVYGRKTKKAGQPLPKVFEWERDSYDTVEQAVEAAKRRSEETDLPETDLPETQLPRRKRPPTILRGE